MKVSKLNRRYGWKRQLPDHRDFKYTVPSRILAALPPSANLISLCPPVYDQSVLGSCTGNAIGGGHQFEQIRQLLPTTGTSDAVVIAAAVAKSFVPSRLFIYWNERDMEGSTNEDSGAEIRDGIKSVVNVGVCPETLWPYDTSRFKDKPPDQCYQDALDHQVVAYYAVTQTLESLKGCLADGYPFVFGFTVYDAFESKEVAATGELNMPQPFESVCGGHAVMAVGYDDATQRFLVRNSWGEKWGKKGYFTIPYAYLLDSNLSADFWTIRMVEVSDHPEPEPQPLPPEPSPKPCDWSLLFPAAKAFTDAAENHADISKKVGDGIPASIDRILEAGLRGLQGYLQRVGQVRTRRR